MLATARGLVGEACGVFRARAGLGVAHLDGDGEAVHPTSRREDDRHPTATEELLDDVAPVKDGALLE